MLLFIIQVKCAISTNPVPTAYFHSHWVSTTGQLAVKSFLAMEIMEIITQMVIVHYPAQTPTKERTREDKKIVKGGGEKPERELNIQKEWRQLEENWRVGMLVFC